MEHMLRSAVALAPSNPGLAAWLVGQADALSAHGRVDIAAAAQAKYCAVCFSFLVAGKSSSVQIRHARRPKPVPKDAAPGPNRPVHPDSTDAPDAMLSQIEVKCRVCGQKQLHMGTRRSTLAQRRMQHILSLKGDELSRSGQFFVDNKGSNKGSNNKRRKPDEGGGSTPKTKKRNKRSQRAILQNMLDSQQIADNPHTSALSSFMSKLM